MSQKFLIMNTSGPEDAEKASIAFSLAVSAQAGDYEVTMGMQKNAVYFARKDGAKDVTAHGMPPLQSLIDTFLEAGGKMLVCTPCLVARGIKEEELTTGAAIAGGATFVTEAVEAHKVMVY